MNRYGEMLVFVRAVADGGFSAAARNLALTPSAVSKLVARMENRLGVVLFRRSSRTFALTPEGEAFYASALRAIEAVDEAEATVLAGTSTPDVLRIRSMPTFATSQLARLLPAFHRQNPGLRIELQLRLEPSNLLDGGMDVAIHVGRLADSALIAHPFARTRWIICASPAYLRDHGTPAGPAELDRHECVNFVPSMAASVWSVRGAGASQRRVKITSTVTTNQGQMLLELARAGLGIVRLAEFHVMDDLLAGRLVELFPTAQSPEEDPIYAVYEGRRHLSARVRLFLDFLDVSFPDPPPWHQRHPTEGAVSG